MAFNIVENSSNFLSLNVKPVFFVIKEIIFAINTNKEWVKVTSTGIKNFQENVYDMSLLTLLELNYLDLKNHIADSLKVKNIDISMADLFPFHLVVFSGLKSGSEYWIGLTLEWLETDNKLLSKDILDLLIEIQINKKYSQKVRHKIMRMNARNINFK